MMGYQLRIVVLKHEEQEMTKNRWRYGSRVGSRSFFPAVLGALLLFVAVVIPAARASESRAETAISSVPPPLLENFSIFHTPSEVVPPEIADAVTRISAQPSHLCHACNVALAQE